MGIGIFTKSSAEYTKRGKNFSKELDFVAANIIMALVADFMLVWLPAPTLSFACAPCPARQHASSLACAHGQRLRSVRSLCQGAPERQARRRGGLPGILPGERLPKGAAPVALHARLRAAPTTLLSALACCAATSSRADAPRLGTQVPAGYAAFSVAQGAGAVLRNGAKLAGVGFGSSLIGVTATNIIVAARQMLDPNFAPPNAPQACACAQPAASPLVWPCREGMLRVAEARRMC